MDIKNKNTGKCLTSNLERKCLILIAFVNLKFWEEYICFVFLLFVWFLQLSLSFIVIPLYLASHYFILLFSQLFRLSSLHNLWFPTGFLLPIGLQFVTIGIYLFLYFDDLSLPLHSFSFVKLRHRDFYSDLSLSNLLSLLLLLCFYFSSDDLVPISAIR